MEAINTVGRRKAAVARIYVNEGKGQITVNQKDYKDYFPEERLQYVVEQPIKIAEVEGKYDIKVNLDGGGFKGQSEAVRMAIARALVKLNEDFRSPLKSKKYLNLSYLQVMAFRKPSSST